MFFFSAYFLSLEYDSTHKLTVAFSSTSPRNTDNLIYSRVTSTLHDAWLTTGSFVVDGAIGCGQNSFTLVWWYQQFLSGFLAKSHFPRVSRLSLMIRMIMKWSLGLCTEPLVFDLQLRKTSARRPSDEGAVRAVIASNGVPYLQIWSVGPNSKSGREKEGKDKKLDFYRTLCNNNRAVSY